MNKIFDLLPEKKTTGIIYFTVLVVILVSIWAVLVTKAVSVQSEAAQSYPVGEQTKQ